MEKEWQRRRDVLRSTGVTCLTQWAQCGIQVINFIDEDLFQIKKSELCLI
jgi:hypothetical protein